MSVLIYGIKNCDTMKTAMLWLDAHKIAYLFHDYKKSGTDVNILKQAIQQHGWENVLNRKGASWRALPEKVRVSMEEAGAISAAQENPSLIRRPLLVHGEEIYLGFSGPAYEAIFQKS